jgi:AraC-like DNA-binding protein
MTALGRPKETTAVLCSEQIARLVAALDPESLRTGLLLDGVRLCEAASWSARAAGAACIVILCGHGGAAGFRHCYRVQTALAPLEPLTWEPGDGPASCLSVPLDLQLTAELMLVLDDMQACPAPAGGMQPWIALDDGMADTVLRLLRALSCALDARVLGPGIVGELVYRALTGPQGALVGAALGHQASIRRIGKALRRIRESYADAVDVAALASEAGMSIAAFHAHFKALTRTTPIQFLKTTRLQQARLLMIREGVGAAYAAQLVGYESNSQFSREFKRLFGRTPTQEALRMKAALCPDETGRPPHAVHLAPNKDFSSPVPPRPYLS